MRGDGVGAGLGVEVGRMLQWGANLLEIEVTNTQANQMYEEPRPSGLLGPVRLRPFGSVFLQVNTP